MLGKHHLLFGTTSGVMAATILMQSGQLSIPGALGFAAFSAFGSLLPDIDHEESLVSKRILPNTSKLLKFIPHRTVTHDIVFYLIIAIPLLLFAKPPFWLWGLFFGIAGHLLLDSMTTNGIPVFWVANRKHAFHLFPKKMRPKSSGTPAFVITLLLSLSCIGVTIWKWYPYVFSIVRSAIDRVNAFVDPIRSLVERIFI